MRRKRMRRNLPAERRTVAAGIVISENPNRAKRHGGNANHREHGTTSYELQRIRFGVDMRDGTRAAGFATPYAPLTVRTPIKRARIEPKFTSYTV